MDRTGSYRDLIAWQKAMVLARSVYQITATWPADHRFELTSQVPRAAISVPSNIAEGSGRTGIPEFRHGVSVAHGSLCELETQLQLGIDLGLCDPARGQAVLQQPRRLAA